MPDDILPLFNTSSSSCGRQYSPWFNGIKYAWHLCIQAARARCTRGADAPHFLPPTRSAGLQLSSGVVHGVMLVGHPMKDERAASRHVDVSIDAEGVCSYRTPIKPPLELAAAQIIAIDFADLNRLLSFTIVATSPQEPENTDPRCLSPHLRGRDRVTSSLPSPSIGTVGQALRIIHPSVSGVPDLIRTPNIYR